MKSGHWVRKMAFGAIIILGVSTVVSIGQADQKKSTNDLDSNLVASKDTVQSQTNLDSMDVAAAESNLGDIIADSLRATSGAEIAVVSADEIIPVHIPSGKVSEEQILKTLRYGGDTDNTVVILHLTGAQLLKAAERSVSRAPHPFDGFLQVSGAYIAYMPGQNDARKVVVTIPRMGPIDSGHVYAVATTSSLANGSLGYFEVWNKYDIFENTGTSIAGSLKAYLGAHKTINATLEGRIIAQ